MQSSSGFLLRLWHGIHADKQKSTMFTIHGTNHGKMLRRKTFHISAYRKLNPDLAILFVYDFFQ